MIRVIASFALATLLAAVVGPIVQAKFEAVAAVIEGASK